MHPDHKPALGYLRPPAGGLWTWAEQGSVVVWKDGATVAFRAEIEQLLETLSPDGLPPFGSLVFLLAACRGRVPVPEDLLIEPASILHEDLGARMPLLAGVRRQLRVQLEAALAELQKVRRLPAALTAGARGRGVLAAAVFEAARVERQVKAESVLTALRDPAFEPGSGLPELGESSEPAGGTLRQVHIVAEGLKRHTVESLALRLRTGLDALPDAADSGDLPVDRVRALLAELERDDEHGALARASRDLMAAVRLPRRLERREQLAVGGVADITNRGPLDRLLLSELANDDLTLAVRVALNEALYLHREPPAGEPPATLAILMDSGLRLWGVPRVLATAVALAVIARDDRHASVMAWRARGAGLVPVDLLSRNGLHEHLAALAVEVHPGAALDAFAKALPEGVSRQSVLVTEREVLADSDFRRNLTDCAAPPDFIATIDRSGSFELHATPLSRRPPVCAAQLDLAAIFPPEPGIPPLDPDAAPNLPALLRVRPCPFRFPIPDLLGHWSREADGSAIAVTRKRQLVRFRGADRGAEILDGDIPPGRVQWIGSDGNWVHLLLAPTTHRPARWISYPRDGKASRCVELGQWSGFCWAGVIGDVFVLSRPGAVAAFSTVDGACRDRIRNPPPWISGRYFRVVRKGTPEEAPRQATSLCWDGQALRLEPVGMGQHLAPLEVQHVFEREGLDSPWFFCRNGGIRSAVTGESIPSPFGERIREEYAVVRTSLDGHRLAACTARTRRVFQFDLKTGEFQEVRLALERMNSLDQPPDRPNTPVFRGVKAVSIGPAGIAFEVHGGLWWRIELNDWEVLRATSITPAGQAPRPVCRFSRRCAGTVANERLRFAQWPCGSVVFQDDRGLLHFRSHAATVPEVSLLLLADEIAGWTSDGGRCGQQRWFEEPMKSEPRRVFECLLRFVAHLGPGPCTSASA